MVKSCDFTRGLAFLPFKGIRQGSDLCFDPCHPARLYRYIREGIKNSRNAKFIPGQEEKEGSILWRY